MEEGCEECGGMWTRGMFVPDLYRLQLVKRLSVSGITLSGDFFDSTPRPGGGIRDIRDTSGCASIEPPDKSRG